MNPLDDQLLEKTSKKNTKKHKNVARIKCSKRMAYLNNHQYQFRSGHMHVYYVVDPVQYEAHRCDNGPCPEWGLKPEIRAISIQDEDMLLGNSSC
jgi:hypothetical protein